VTLLIIGALVALVLRKLWTKNGDGEQAESQEDFRLSLQIGGWLLLLGSLVYALGELPRGGVGWLLIPLGLFLLLLRPLLLVEEVFLPRGWVKATYRGARIGLWASRDRRGQALLYANLALLRAPKHHDPRDDEAYLTERQKQLPGGAASLLAASLLLARREGLPAVVPLLRCLDSVDPSVKPAWAMAVASELLIVDAVRLGDWPKVRRLSAESPSTPLLAFLSACAQVFVPELEAGQPVPPLSRDRLYWLWLKAPQKQHLWWLLEKAQDHSPGRPTNPQQKQPPSSARSGDNMADPPRLDAALAALGRLWQTDALRVTPEQLRLVGDKWDRALVDKATERLLLTRALSLAIPGTEQKTQQALRTQVVATLRSYLGQGAVPIRKLFPDGKLPQPSVLAEAALQVRAELLEQFESATTQLEERTTDKRELPWLDEWREWAQVRDTYQRIEDFGGPEARRLAWTSLHRQANNWACWLWNARSEKVLANAVFRFLLREAEALGDDRSAQLAKKNVGSGL
jgi:hypothetical protein